MADKIKERWWGIFRTGSFTDMNGKRVEADEKKIDQIIESTKNFSYQNDEIPIVIGHPKIDSPKWGSVNKNDLIKQKDKKNGWTNLLAKPKDLVKEFSEWIEKKMYNSISISLRPDWSIKHIGFLGATPPAVTGLPSVYLSEDDDQEINFQFSEFARFEISSYPFRKISELLRGIKNYMIEQKGADYANGVMPEGLFDNLDEAPRVFQISEDTAVTSFSEDKNSNNNKNKSEDEMKTTEELESKVTELSETLEVEKTEKQKLAEENARLKAEQLKNEIKSFCESAEMRNKITPALQPIVEGIYIQLAEGEELQFSEGEGDDKKEVKLSAVEGLKKVLASLPDAVEFGEKTNKENAAKDTTDMGNADAIAKKALAFVESERQAGRTISISAAVKYVKDNN